MAGIAAVPQQVLLSGPAGEARLTLPAGHPLPGYLRRFPLYDRFVPTLAGLIGGKTMIDIGANVGDTTALTRLVSSTPPIVAVEPDPVFRGFLARNIAENHLPDVQVVSCAVSSTPGTGRIVKAGNAASGSFLAAAASSGSATESLIAAKTLAEVLADLPSSHPPVGLIKSDTDGSDWDILATVADWLSAAHEESAAVPAALPFVFYEHQLVANGGRPDDPAVADRADRYTRSLTALRDRGYTRYEVFDNFGTHLVSTADLDTVTQLAAYPVTAELANYRPTYWFVDVLLIPPGGRAMAHDAVRRSRNSGLMVGG